MKYFIKTFGCQMNTSDSERLAAFLQQHDFSPCENISDAGIVIFNTCGIKQTAENRAYSMINNLRKKHKAWDMGHGAKQENAKLKIIMTGCLANRADVKKRMNSKVDLFFAIKDLKIFENWIIENCKLQILSQRKKLSNQEEISYLSIQPKHYNKYQAYIPIMTGCNNFCAYCVVPYARGREVSRPTDEILSEIKSLVSQGYKHFILLGQNVNSYNWRNKNSKEINFAKLLKSIDTIPGKFWVSFVSSHPKDMSDEVIETIAKSKKVCEWIHLPVQAGNDLILQKMNRKYTQKHYLGRLKKIKAAFRKYKPDFLFSVSSDIIVGFPSETKKQFEDSAEVMKKAKFDMVFFGRYSPRPGTMAWRMKDNVSQKEKARRENFLNEILKGTSLANNKKYVGKIIEVLIEQKKNEFYFGKTRTMKNVKMPKIKKNLVGKIIKAKITEANIWNLEGKIIYMQ